jgi:glycosidase
MMLQDLCHMKIKLTSNDVRRHHLGLIALLTLPGIPQIYYGNEIGAYGSYPDNRRDMPRLGLE